MTVVIIPAFEPTERLVGYVDRLFSAGAAGVVVTDDGSGEEYSRVFDQLRAIPDCSVITLEKSHGRGGAIKTAFSFCREKYGGDHVFVTIDGSCGYIIPDVFKAAAFASEYDDSLIIGSRCRAGGTIRRGRRPNGAFISRLLRLTCGIKVTDSRVGLRAFSYKLLPQLLEIPGESFDYELNQLILLSKNGVTLREIPIQPNKRGAYRETLSDSLKDAAVILRGPGKFAVSGVVSGVADVVSFFVFFRFVFALLSPWLRSLLATVCARLLSASINYTLNRKFVFNDKATRSAAKYAAVMLCQLSLSYAFACLWNAVFTLAFAVTAAKALCDLSVSLVSYLVQSRWVFRQKRRKNSFWSGGVRICRAIYRFFGKRYKCLVKAPEKGTVYVCRHLAMKAPTVILRSVDFDIHTFVLSPFFAFKTAFLHFRDSTFAKNRKITRTVKALFSAFFAAPTIRGMKSIPVYRNSTGAFGTLKKAARALESGESVLIFADIDYNNITSKESDIYKGFLLLDAPYYKAKNEHLRFVPICIDSVTDTVYEKLPIRFEDGDLRGQIDEKALRIKTAIEA